MKRFIKIVLISILSLFGVLYILIKSNESFSKARSGITTSYYKTVSGKKTVTLKEIKKLQWYSEDLGCTQTELNHAELTFKNDTVIVVKTYTDYNLFTPLFYKLGLLELDTLSVFKYKMISDNNYEPANDSSKFISGPVFIPGFRDSVIIEHYTFELDSFGLLFKMYEIIKIPKSEI